jgi:hypothetical protein
VVATVKIRLELLTLSVSLDTREILIVDSQFARRVLRQARAENS